MGQPISFFTALVRPVWRTLFRNPERYLTVLTVRTRLANPASLSGVQPNVFYFEVILSEPLIAARNKG